MFKKISDYIKSWVLSHGGITNSVAVIYTSLYAFYEMTPAAQVYINTTVSSIYHSLPHWLASLVAGLIGPLFLWYWRKLSLKGKLQIAQSVEASSSTTTISKT